MTIFRVDFGSDIGLGHLKRSLVYAKNFNKVVYVSKSNEKDLLPYPLKTIHNEEKFFEIIKKLKPSKIVIDSYTFKYEYEVKIKKSFPQIKLICIDDLYKKHYCDEVVNPNLCIKPYTDLPSFIKVNFVGPLIQNDFKNKKYYKKNGLFISFGATDAMNITLQVLKQLKNINIPINIYTTSINSNIKKLQRFCKLNKNFHLYIDKNIAQAMAKSQFGIISASTLVYEALAVDLDFVAIKVASNQDGLEKCLKKKRKKVIEIKEISKLKNIIKNVKGIK